MYRISSSRIVLALACLALCFTAACHIHTYGPWYDKDDLRSDDLRAKRDAAAFDPVVRGFFRAGPKPKQMGSAKLSAFGRWNPLSELGPDVDLTAVELYGRPGAYSVGEVVKPEFRLARQTDLPDMHTRPFWAIDPDFMRTGKLNWRVEWANAPWDGSSEYTSVLRYEVRFFREGLLQTRYINVLKGFDSISAIQSSQTVGGIVADAGDGHTVGTSLVATGIFFGTQNAVVYDITIDFIPEAPANSVITGISAEHGPSLGDTQRLRIPAGSMATPCSRSLYGRYDSEVTTYHLFVDVKHKAPGFPEETDSYDVVFSGIDPAASGLIMRGK